MKISLVIINSALVFVLAACESPAEYARQLRMQDEQNCMEYGYQQGNPDFARCLQRENIARRERDNLQAIESRRLLTNNLHSGSVSGIQNADPAESLTKNQRKALRNCDFLPPENQMACRGFVWSTR